MKNRIFITHDGYFDVEESLDGSFYDSRTRIIITGNAMGPTKGIQILRFYRFKSLDLEGPWQLASNPYAGIYLLPEEWEKVFAAIKRAKTTESKVQEEK